MSRFVRDDGKWNGIIFKGISFLWAAALWFLMPAALSDACCDAQPKQEIIVESDAQRYVSLLVPSYSLRSVQGIPIEFYNDRTLLFLAQRIVSGEPYKVIWRQEIEDPGSDFFSLFVSDQGSVVLLSDSLSSVSDGVFLRIINRNGRTVRSYSKKEVGSLIGSTAESVRWNTDEIKGTFQNEIFILADLHKEIFRINSQNGEIEVLRNERR